MTRVEIDLPSVSLQDEQLNVRDLTDAAGLARELRAAAALFWFERGMISSGKAAEVAGLSRVDFLNLAARQRVPTMDFDPDEIRAVMDKPREGGRG